MTVDQANRLGNTHLWKQFYKNEKNELILNLQVNVVEMPIRFTVGADSFTMVQCMILNDTWFWNEYWKLKILVEIENLVHALLKLTNGILIWLNFKTREKINLTI